MLRAPRALLLSIGLPSAAFAALVPGDVAVDCSAVAAASAAGAGAEEGPPPQRRERAVSAEEPAFCSSLRPAPGEPYPAESIREGARLAFEELKRRRGLAVTLDDGPRTRHWCAAVGVAAVDAHVDESGVPVPATIHVCPLVLSRWVRDQGQLFFIMAHEMAHIQMRHFTAINAHAMDFERHWFAAQPPRYLDESNLAQVQGDFSAALCASVAGFSRPKEDEADMIAAAWAGEAGCDVEHGADAVIARDIVAAADRGGRATHSSARRRAGAIRQAGESQSLLKNASMW